MNKLELILAWLNVSAAVREKIEFPNGKHSLFELAQLHGRNHPNDELAKKVLACINFEQLKELIA